MQDTGNTTVGKYPGGDDEVQQPQECSSCGGFGTIGDSPFSMGTACPECDGSGVQHNALPSAFEYFSDEKVAFGNEPGVFACLTFDFENLDFTMNIEEDGKAEYEISSAHPYWPANTVKSIKKFIKEVRGEYGVKVFPEALQEKAESFLLLKDKAESFGVVTKRLSLFQKDENKDLLVAYYFPGDGKAFSGAISVQYQGHDFSGTVDQPEVFSGAVNLLNDALQEANEPHAVSDIFCLLLQMGRDLSPASSDYGYDTLIPYEHPRKRMLEELLR